MSFKASIFCLLCIIQEQYKFVYEAVLEYLLSENTAIPVNYFTSRLARLQDIDRNSKGRRTGMSVQFEVKYTTINTSYIDRLPLSPISTKDIVMVCVSTQQSVSTI